MSFLHHFAKYEDQECVSQQRIQYVCQCEKLSKYFYVIHLSFHKPAIQLYSNLPNDQDSVRNIFLLFKHRKLDKLPILFATSQDHAPVLQM